MSRTSSSPESRSAVRRSPIGRTGAATARTSKPPPKRSTSSSERMKEPEIVPPVTRVKITSVNMASIIEVRSRLRSG